MVLLIFTFIGDYFNRNVRPWQKKKKILVNIFQEKSLEENSFEFLKIRKVENQCEKENILKYCFCNF